MPIEIDPADPVFTIGVAARLTGLSHKQLRVLESNGIVTPARTDHGHRLYSRNQLEVLRYVAYLVGTRKVNAAGVRVVLDLFEKLPEGEQQRVLADADDSVPEEPAVALTPMLEGDPGGAAAAFASRDEPHQALDAAEGVMPEEPGPDAAPSSDTGPASGGTRAPHQ
jgi:DNA-binding transcriptional MerR regulator